MLKILGLSLLALLMLAGIITMIVVNLRDHRASKKSTETPAETKGPFTRPSAPANPGRVAIRTSRDPDHTHMRSGTIYENRNPEQEGALRVRTSPIQTNLRMRSRDGDPFDTIQESFEGVGRSMGDISRAIREGLVSPSPAAPGVVVRITPEETTQHPGASPERLAQERLILEAMLKAERENQKAEPPEIKRVSRYKRKPVI